MNRLTSWAFTPAIQAAMSAIPERLHPRVACDYLTGTSPTWAGLHGYTDASHGRSYSDTPHCTYSFQQSASLAKTSRRTTVVLPLVVPPSVVVHELGHVLHESLGFEPTALPVTRYAQTNRWEAFAEAFTSWLIPGYAARPDGEFLSLMEQLCAA